MIGRGVLAVALAALAVPSWAQSPAMPRLTRAEAQQRALANHPRIQAARLRAAAAGAAVGEARSAYFPAVGFNLTAVGAEQGSAIAAGGLATSSLADRLAGGVVANQLITDFGRARSLSASLSLTASALEGRLDEVRAAVVLEVSQAYFQALAADAVLTVSRSDLDTKQLLARQVAALARSELKSTLDVSFADVAVSEAELAVSRSESAAAAARARLSAAMGDTGPAAYLLTDEVLRTDLAADPQADIDQAVRSRPALIALSASREAAQRFADAEKRLAYPTINVLAAAGTLPLRDEKLRGSYGAAGVNISVPVLTGGLFSARRLEASLRAQAAARDVDDLTATISRDVRIAWLEAEDAFKRLDVTARLVQQVDTTMRLARTRYDAGLTGIVELTQALYSQTSAHVEAARAKYEYLDRRAILDFTVGRIQ